MLWSEIVKVTIIQGQRKRRREGRTQGSRGGEGRGVDDWEIGHGSLPVISVIFIPVILKRSAPPRSRK